MPKTEYLNTKARKRANATAAYSWRRSTRQYGKYAAARQYDVVQHLRHQVYGVVDVDDVVLAVDHLDEAFGVHPAAMLLLLT